MRVKKTYDAAVRRLHAMRRAGFRGAFSLAKYQLSETLGSSGPGTVTLRSRYCAHPLYCRRHSSDAKVFYDIFACREYDCFDDVADVKLIVDCGANVGYSSAYFLSRYPGAKLIAVEPDPDNFRMLQRNLAPWSGQTTLVQAGVWSHSCGLVFPKENYRDGKQWAVQVREARPDETPEAQAVDIGSLLRDSGHERISMLKVDIERSETVVFAQNYESWIDRVDNIAIELHDPECERVFAAAIKGLPFDVSTSRELTVCKRKAGADGAAGARAA